MALKAKYCSQCGAAVAVRVMEDRIREVCTRCGTIFYRNPLPVAASVVLNDQREVLLVKRRNEPHKGMWCLPIGFAELGETIGQAAQRELKEEAGIEARILRLLDSASLDSGFYGDLLIVTFEMEKVDGMETPGDDAEVVAYYPLNRLPPLAFTANATALQICAEMHADEWAIQDSFVSLQSDEGRMMLSDALVNLIRDHATEVTRLWFEDVRLNPTTTSYRKIDADNLFQRGFIALSQVAQGQRSRRRSQGLLSNPRL